MKHRFWTKFVVAGLVVMGEGAFASESSERGNDRYESNGNAIQLSLPEVLDDAGSGPRPPMASANSTQPGINHSTQSFTAVTAPVSDLLKYHPFNPRAPPLPAH